MFIEPAPTAYDLRWRMFGTPVRVNPFFWLVAAVIGWNWFLYMGFAALLIGIGCVFVSILVHEFGHVLAMRVYGLRSHVVLYGFGGLAVPQGGFHGRAEKIVVSLAGPAAGLIFYAVVYATEHAYGWSGRNDYTHVLYVSLAFMNLVWSLVNLLPIFPLDGGQVSREVLTMISPRHGDRNVFMVSAVAAALMSAHGFMIYADVPLIPWPPVGGLMMGIVFAILAIQNVQFYQATRRGPTFTSGWDDDRPPWR